MLGPAVIQISCYNGGMVHIVWGSLAATLAATFGLGAAVLGVFNQRKARKTDARVQEIHLTLNSRLTEWNEQIMAQIRDLKAERDKAQQQAGKAAE